MGTVDFDVFDADNHYYEATDAFIRHLPKGREKLVQWATLDRKPRMIVDNKVFRFIPTPTFDPVARPGCLDDYFRGKRAGDDIRAAFGDLEPIDPAYREPDARIKLMDTQGIEACFMFPTLGVGIEEAMLHDPAAMHDLFHAFNAWMLADWKFDYDGRIVAAHHSGDAGYGRSADEWGGGGEFQAFRNDPFRTVTGGHRPIHDTIAAFACHGVFRRHPNLR